MSEKDNDILPENNENNISGETGDFRDNEEEHVAASKNCENTDDRLQNCEEYDGEKYSADDKPEKSKTNRKPKKISLQTFLLCAVALVVATLLLTYSICNEFFKAKYADSIVKGDEVVVKAENMIDLLEQYVDYCFYGDANKDAMMIAALKAYIAATGDPYSAYYTPEEYNANKEETAGRMCGIGVNIINDKIEYGGETVSVLNIINVFDDSPALKAGVKHGDLVVYVGAGDNIKSINELGYDNAIKNLLGEEGTSAEFTVLRKEGEEYVKISFSIVRANVETVSVRGTKFEKAPTVGVVRITEFDYTTPQQFEETVERLKNEGCTKFVIDLRYNPGGLQTSVAAVLSYFLNENDVYIQIKDKKGNVSKASIVPVEYDSEDMKPCNIVKEKIGMYRDLDVVLLCNNGSASASELFIANLKDYGIAKVVGEKTYGKGILQTTYPIKGGSLGAIKLTTHYYFSGGDTELKGYHETGIVPDVDVGLSEKAKEYNFNVLPQEFDDQLIAAVNIFN